MSLVPRLNLKRLNDILSIEVGANVTASLFEAEHLPVFFFVQEAGRAELILLPGEDVLVVALAAFINSTTKTMQQ